MIIAMKGTKLQDDPIIVINSERIIQMLAFPKAIDSKIVLYIRFHEAPWRMRTSTSL